MGVLEMLHDIHKRQKGITTNMKQISHKQTKQSRAWNKSGRRNAPTKQKARKQWKDIITISKHTNATARTFTTNMKQNEKEAKWKATNRLSKAAWNTVGADP